MTIYETCRDINELTTNAQKACRLFLTECEKQGLKVLITETYRSQERQNYLYEQGRTREGNKVTWTKSSRHTSRRAWDICQNVKGKEYSDKSFFKNCGIIASKFGITWGGNWSTPDTPHFEISENWSYKESEEEEMTSEEKAKFNALVSIVEEQAKINTHQNEIIEIMGKEIEELKQGHKKQNDILWEIKQKLKM